MRVFDLEGSENLSWEARCPFSGSSGLRNPGQKRPNKKGDNEMKCKLYEYREGIAQPKENRRESEEEKFAWKERRS
jgi:hypothetical protein